jgi:predicted dithiol-disulfide oxidoreductase (DUF899 family)
MSTPSITERTTVATRDEWNAARERLLVREKEHTRLGDELARARQALPWVRVEKDYRFETPDGPRTLAELFEGRSQLVVYHFMFGPSFELGCPVNSSIADALDGLVPHLNANDVTMLLVSSAPSEQLEAYRERMGWSIPWASTAGGDFNVELGFASSAEQVQGWGDELLASLPPVAARNARASGTDLASYVAEGFGVTVFALQDGVVYQTYAATGRGVEFLMSYYPILDRAPRGRDEGEEFQLWIRRHDEYGHA